MIEPVAVNWAAMEPVLPELLLIGDLAVFLLWEVRRADRQIGLNGQTAKLERGGLDRAPAFNGAA